LRLRRTPAPFATPAFGASAGARGGTAGGAGVVAAAARGPSAAASAGAGGAGPGTAAAAVLVSAVRAAGCRHSIHMTMARFTSSSAATAMAHSGNPVRGGATLTSKSAGPLWRWRSLSDFFRASRMKDIDHPP